jgi:hypothetical protein
MVNNYRFGSKIQTMLPRVFTPTFSYEKFCYILLIEDFHGQVHISTILPVSAPLFSSLLNVNHVHQFTFFTHSFLENISLSHICLTSLYPSSLAKVTAKSTKIPLLIGLLCTVRKFLLFLTVEDMYVL